MAERRTPRTIEVNHSAKTGKFVTESYAKAHPSTTEHENRGYRKGAAPTPPRAPKKK
jgi:hypothetical protein